MGDSYTFAVDVFRIVCARLNTRADDLRLLVETTSSFEEWLAWEAFLACKLREASYPFCEVVANPPTRARASRTRAATPTGTSAI